MCRKNAALALGLTALGIGLVAGVVLGRGWLCLLIGAARIALGLLCSAKRP